MQIFSGNSNQDLAKKLAEVIEGSLAQVESSKFANGEARVAIKEKKLNGEVVLLQSLSIPVDEHIIEFCLLADAISRQGTSSLIGVVPWLGYSKQDKVFMSGEPLSSKVIAQILQTTKMKKLITFDLHNRAILGFFDIPVVELSAKPLFLDYFRPKVTAQTVVVAPDAGAVKASAAFAQELNVPIVYMDKRRDLKTGKVEVVGISGNVKGCAVIMVDDMIVTGSTLMETAKVLKKAGAKRISFAATHHLWVPGVQEKLDKSQVDEVVVTDTVEVQGKSPKLKVISVAQLVVDELR
jgi:ribose-phosphate pyrophosphokinase